MMTNQQLEELRQWAERVAILANDSDINFTAADIVHDVEGILASDEHFLPRL
jgi:hypothetical protein